MLLLIAIFAITSLLIYWTILRPYTFYRFYQKLPYTKTDFIPIISTFGNSKEYVQSYHDYYWGILEEKRKNPDLKVIGRNIGSTYMLYILDPVLVQQMFTASDKDIIKHQFQNSFIKTLSPNGLVLSQGKTWKKHRKMFAKGFSYKQVEQSLTIIREAAKLKIDQLSSGDAINATTYFKKAAGGILSKAFFGLDVNDVEIDGIAFPLYLSQLISDLSCEAYSYGFSLLGMTLVKMKLYASLRDLQKRIQKTREAVRKIVQHQVQLRNQRSQNPDSPLKDVQINMWDTFLNNSEPFTEDQIVDEFITFFSDGVYTSGHFMMMACYYLAIHPQWQQKIRQQFSSQGFQKSFQKQQTLHKLQTLQSCIWQTFRLAPPVVTGIQRIALRDILLNKEYPIKKDTMVMACHIVNHLDPQYHDQPLQYKPNRWTDQQSKTKASAKQYPGVFMPFSIGVRNCPGQHFAKAQGTIFLAMLINKFDIRMKDDTYQIKFTQKFLRQPETPFEIVFHAVQE